MRNSIRARLTLVIVSLTIGPLLVVGIVLSWQSYMTLEQYALTLQQEAAKRVASEVTAFFQRLEDKLRFTVQTQRLFDLDQNRQRSALSSLLAYESAFDELHLLNSQGQDLVSVYRTGLASTATVDRSRADEFVIPQTTGQIYYGPVRYDPSTYEPLMTIAIPIINLRAGSTDGVLVSVARIKRVWDLIAGIQVNPGQSIYIVAAEGQVVAHRNPSIVLRGSTFAVPKQRGIQPGLSGASTVLAFDTMSLGQQQFSVVAEQTVSEALAPAFNVALISAGVVIVALAFAIALSLVIARQFVQPIQTMATVAQAISTGDLSQQVQITSQDELGILANAFNSMTMQLQSLIGGLEQRIAERTADLERRAVQLMTAAEVAQAASGLLDTGQLLKQTVELAATRFNLYHVGLFLIDETGQWAVLQAASSEGGQRMLARQHRLRVGQEGIVGYVTGRGEPRIALDVGADAVFFDNPDLPDTRSEMALPLRARGVVIGALDVQSKEPAAFSPEDIATFQTLADQIALAISNTRLFQQAQESLEAERRAYGELSRRAWQELMQTRPDLGFVSDQQGIMPIGDLWEPQMEQAVRTGKATPGDGDGSVLAIPIQVRGNIIGVVDAHKPRQAGQWTAEEAALMETLVEQLGAALESARLYQDTQRRAFRERLTSHITSRMRESLDVDTVLRTAAQEIGAALELMALDVRLSTPEELTE